MVRTKSTRAWLAMATLATMLGCGSDPGDPWVDGGSEPGADAGPAGDVDSGPVSCEADMATAASTAGCNGGFAGEPAMNAPGGRCELGTDTMPSGSCTSERSVCMGDLAGSGSGWCVILCDAPMAYVDAQSCPAGHRCFRMGSGVDAYGVCFRDCDAEHPCPEGWTCTGENRCEESPPT